MRWRRAQKDGYGWMGDFPGAGDPDSQLTDFLLCLSSVWPLALSKGHEHDKFYFPETLFPCLCSFWITC